VVLEVKVAKDRQDLVPVVAVAAVGKEDRMPVVEQAGRRNLLLVMVMVGSPAILAAADRAEPAAAAMLLLAGLVKIGADTQ